MRTKHNAAHEQKSQARRILEETLQCQQTH